MPSVRIPKRLATLALLAALLSAQGAQAAQDGGSGALHPDWCQLDDPAWYRGELERLASSAQGAGPSAAPGKPVCPTSRPAAELPDELVLPLACGHAMVFRKVVVDAGTVLDQQTIKLGDRPAGKAKNVAELTRGYREESIAGAFNHGFGERSPDQPVDLLHLSGRSYYIGKYEVSEFQYRLFVDTASAQPDCAAAEARRTGATFSNVPPARDLGWFDAVAYTRVADRFIIAAERDRLATGQPGALPRELGMTAYLRLPSEAEWEFAARGGTLARDKGDNPLPPALDPKTQKPRDPMPAEVAGLFATQVRGLGAAARDYIPIGMRMPNLLGLYDTLGGVGEIVQDFFRFTRPDGKPHGQIGGYVVRGGGADSSEAMIGYGAREEFPLYTLEGERRHKTNGFRLVLSLPVTVEEAVTDPDDEPMIPAKPAAGPVAAAPLPPDKQWVLAVGQAIDKAVQGSGAGPMGIASVMRDLQAIRERPDEAGALKGQILQAEEKLRNATVQLNDAARGLLVEKVRSAVLLAHNIQAGGLGLTSDAIEGKRIAYDLMQSKLPLVERRKIELGLEQVRERSRENERALDATFDFYVASIAKLSETASSDAIAALDAAAADFRRQNLKVLATVADFVRANLRDASAAKGVIDQPTRRRWLYTLDFTREKRQILSTEIR